MRQLVSLLFGSLLLLGGVWFSDASGRTWVASPDGAEDGLFADILRQAAEADTVRLLPGTHDWGPKPIEVSLSIQGENGALLDGNGMRVDEVAWFEFHNVEFFRSGQLGVFRSGRVVFDSCVYREGQWAAAFAGLQSLVVRNSVFRDNFARNRSKSAGISVNDVDTMTVEQCLFANNSSEAGYPYNEFPGSGGGAVSALDCKNATFRKNVFRNNHAVAGSAIFYTGDTVLVEENTFYENDCTAAAISVILYGDSEESRGVIRQNIFAKSTSFGLWIVFGSEVPPRVYCNAFWENNILGQWGCGREDGQWWSCDTQPGYKGINDFHSVLADPMSCSDDSLYVSMDSELAAPTGKPCSPIGGALGFDCGIEPVIAKSWGAVKQSFHGQRSSGSRPR